MTSNDLAKPETKKESTVKSASSKRNKNIPIAGSVHENIEINAEILDEIFHKNNLWMDLAMQIISKDQTVINKTVQDLKDFNSQSLATEI